jgi:hypothetical protein
MAQKWEETKNDTPSDDAFGRSRGFGQLLYRVLPLLPPLGRGGGISIKGAFLGVTIDRSINRRQSSLLQISVIVNSGASSRHLSH